MDHRRVNDRIVSQCKVRSGIGVGIELNLLTYLAFSPQRVKRLEALLV